jgi:DivIVA domain-containing protein
MDLTPQTLRDVEFREKLRGYHPDDVDDFLEEVAVAVDALLARLRAAEGGMTLAPPQPTQVPVAAVEAPADPTLSEGTLSRALLLAQRTADIAIAEAEQSARQILDDARVEADRILADTQSKVGAMTEEARSSAEAAVTELDDRRAGLEREVASLQAWAAKHRDGLREVLSDQLRSLDIWMATSAVPRPPTRMVATPAIASTPPTVASSGEATATYPPIEGPADVLPSEVDAVPHVDLVTNGSETELPPRRPMPDSPGAAVSEAVESGSSLTGAAADLRNGGGGGDGLVLFDQDGEAVEGTADDGGTRMAGRFFRQR